MAIRILNPVLNSEQTPQEAGRLTAARRGTWKRRGAVYHRLLAAYRAARGAQPALGTPSGARSPHPAARHRHGAIFDDGGRARRRPRPARSVRRGRHQAGLGPEGVPADQAGEQRAAGAADQRLARVGVGRAGAQARRRGPRLGVRLGRLGLRLGVRQRGGRRAGAQDGGRRDGRGRGVVGRPVRGARYARRSGAPCGVARRSAVGCPAPPTPHPPPPPHKAWPTSSSTCSSWGPSSTQARTT